MRRILLSVKKYWFTLLLIGSVGFCDAQTDTEFPKGFIMYGKLHSGMITDFTSKPDLYVGGLQLTPQVTVVQHFLRAGAILGGFYGNKKLQGEFGPSLSVKIKTFNAKLQNARVGSLANVNLIIDHLWGTGQQRLLGGGIILDAGNLITFGITAHRDYMLNNWWFQSEVGIRISKKHKTPSI
ncbi:MAG: hypothetical protein ACTHK0_13585 [Ginsengibacter sp.]